MRWLGMGSAQHFAQMRGDALELNSTTDFTDYGFGKGASENAPLLVPTPILLGEPRFD
jgi:hypothetical protein